MAEKQRREEPSRTVEILSEARAELGKLFQRVEHESRRMIEDSAAKGKLSRREAEEILTRFLDRFEERVAKTDRDLVRVLARLADKLPSAVLKQDVEKLDETVQGIESRLAALREASLGRKEPST